MTQLIGKGRKTTATVLALTVLAVTAGAGTAHADQSYRQRNSSFQPFLTRNTTTVSGSLGVRKDDLRWNIAGNTAGTSPNILSELTWEDVYSVEANTKIKHLRPTNSRIFRGAWQLEGELRGGLNYDGRVQDSDYAGDDRTLEFSRATADAHSGYSAGLDAAVGYRFNVAQSVRRGNYTFVTLTPLVGYGYDYKRFKMEGTQVSPPPVGNPPVLDSDYNASWYGPFIGAELGWEHNRHMLNVRGEYHDLTYYADADWNLRTDFAHDPSFEHEGDGSGVKANIQYSYAVDSKYDFTVDLTHEQRRMTDGLDTTYFADGTTAQTRLNEVEQTSQAVRIGMRYGW